MATFALLMFSKAAVGQVYTPQGSEVTSAFPRFDELSAAPKEAWKQYCVQTYPQCGIFRGINYYV